MIKVCSLNSADASVFKFEKLAYGFSTFKSFCNSVFKTFCGILDVLNMKVTLTGLSDVNM